MSARTISIFLPDGNPNSVKIVDLSNRAIRCYLIPRASLSDIKARDELNRPSLYVLCDREGSELYIGECENFFHRIKNHEQNKDFWEIALVFLTKDNSLEKSDVKHLESLAIQAAKSAERMKVLNATLPVRNTLHEFKTETIKEFFEDLKLLISSLGYPAFDRVEAKDENLWFCNNKKTKAEGVYDENGFTVLAGSLIDGEEKPAFAKSFPFAADERKQLLTEKAEMIGDNIYKLKENITFKSPNKAGGFCVGGNVNAWVTWKDVEGKTMDEVFRRKQQE